MPRFRRTCVVAYRQFHPLDFTIIDFMQVNDCEGGRRERVTRTDANSTFFGDVDKVACSL